MKELKNRKKRERLGLLGKIGVNPESQILEIKKPDGRDQASRHSIEVDQMNTNNLSNQEQIIQSWFEPALHTLKALIKSVKRT